MKNLLITTSHRGVFFAQAPEGTELTEKKILGLKNCRMAIKFGTTRGLMQLAETGPTSNSKISAACDIPVLHDVTAVFEVTEEAAKLVWPC